MEIRHLQKTMFIRAATLLLLALLSSCATLQEGDPPNVRVVGLEPLPSEGLELRFALKLRVQNPNPSALIYDGLSVELDLDGSGVASGVSDLTGEIPRFSDAVLTVPVSISAFSALRQMIGRVRGSQGEGSALTKPISYSLTGKLGSGSGSFATDFGDQGEIDLFATGDDETESNTELPDTVE